MKQDNVILTNNSAFNIQHLSLLKVCKEKNRTTVEYALQDGNKPIGVSTYKLLERLPSELEEFLPTSEEIVKRLEIFDDGQKEDV